HIGREGEQYEILSLKALAKTQVDMFTTVIVGNSETQQINGKMVTPRGYAKRYEF
ncbi:MAG: precorrin-3B C(17)-methyltransferase, partial [Niameybacter sp.]